MPSDEDRRLTKLPTITPLPAAPDEAFDRIASVVRKVLNVPVALVSLVDQDRQVFPGASGLPEPYQTSRQTPLTHSFCQHVVADASPFIVADARQNMTVAQNLAIPDLGVIAYAGIPVIDFDGTVVGSLCAIDGEVREWTSAELSLLTDLAAACSAELQLREAAVRAVEASERWHVLARLSEALGLAVTVDEISHTVSVLSMTRLNAMYGGIALLESQNEQIHFIDVSVFPEIAQERQNFSLYDDRPASIAIRQNRALFFETIEQMEELAPGSSAPAAASGGKSFAYLPLVIRQESLGAIVLIWEEERAFSLDDRELLEGLARYTAQAVHRAGLLAERREVAQTLQAALLPALPSASWIEVSGQYRPSHMADAVGGDWYDAFYNVGSNDNTETMTIAVGDVTGHDTKAAAVMGQLQASLRALTLDSASSPEVLLSRLDHVMTQSLPGRMATAVVATLSAQSEGFTEMIWSNAGHLPPLVLRPGQAPELLENKADLLLGFDAGAERQVFTTQLAPGTTVLFFTDGLVERPGKALDSSLSLLLQMVADHQPCELDELLVSLVEHSLTDRHDDDTVLLGVRIPG